MRQAGTLAVVVGGLLWAGTALAQEAGPAPVAATPAAPEVAPEPAPVVEDAPAPVAEAPAATPAMAAIRQNGCLAGPARASEAQISAFLANPASLLSDFGMTSVEMSARVRALVGSDTRSLDPAVAALTAASVDQRAAIGSGLGRAAFACQEVNPDYAALIQSRVADLAFSDVKTAFLAATNDIQVAAIAAAASGGPGGGGAPGLSGTGVAGPGTAGLSGDDVTPTTTGSFPVGNLGGVSYLEGNGGGFSISLTAGSPAGID